MEEGQSPNSYSCIRELKLTSPEQDRCEAEYEAVITILICIPTLHDTTQTTDTRESPYTDMPLFKQNRLLSCPSRSVATPMTVFSASPWVSSALFGASSLTSVPFLPYCCLAGDSVPDKNAPPGSLPHTSRSWSSSSPSPIHQ